MKMITVKLAQLTEKFNPRSDFGGVDELAKSIEAIGLLQPIVAQGTEGEGAVYTVVDGACRLRALKKLGQKETQIILVDAKGAEEAQMAANLMRQDLNLLERARGYERMIRLFPQKYNEAALAKAFSDKIGTVKRLVSVAKRIPAVHDKKLGQYAFEQVELMAQVPAAHMEKVVVALPSPEYQRPFWDAISKVAKSLDWSCDALTTGKLVSAGRAFVIKTGHGQEHAYTMDPAAFKEAKDAYEKKSQKQYGAAEKQHKAKVAEKSEKQKASERAARKKERDERAAAVKELPAVFKKFMARAASMEQIHEAAKEMFEKHVDSDKCRRIWAAFGVKGCDKVSSYELRGKTYDAVLKPFVKSASDAVLIREFAMLGWKDGMTPEQAWVKGMKK